MAPRGFVPAAVAADRGVVERPVPAVPVPRRRRPGLVVAAVVLVGAGSWVGVTAVGSADDRDRVLAVAREVPFGQQLTERDLTEARLSEDPHLRPVPVGDRDQVVGMRATTTLRPGTLLVLDQLSDEPVPGPGEQVVALPVESGRMPTQGVSPGRRVLLVETPPDQPTVTGDGAPAVPVEVEGTVLAVGETDEQDTRTVDVLVASVDGPRLATLARAGRVAIVLLPGGR